MTGQDKLKQGKNFEVVKNWKSRIEWFRLKIDDLMYVEWNYMWFDGWNWFEWMVWGMLKVLMCDLMVETTYDHEFERW